MKFTSVFRTVSLLNGQSLNSQTFAPNGTMTIDAQQDRTLRKRLAPLVFFIRLLVLILLAWSAGNGFLFTSATLRELTDQQEIAVSGGLVFALLFEAGKYFFGAYTLRALIRGWWREGNVYRLALVMLLPVTATWFAGSYWLTTQGGMEGLRLQFTQPAAHIANDTLRRQVNPDLEALRQARDSVYRQAIDRSSPRTATRLFMAFQNEISRLETINTESRKVEKQQDDQHKERLQIRLEKVLYWLSRLGGWSELLTLALLVFLEIYAWKTQVQQRKSAPETSASSQDTSINYLKQRARQCWKRAHHEQSSEKTRQNNLDKAEDLIQQLNQLGIQTQVDANDPHNLLFNLKKQPRNHDSKYRATQVRTRPR